jgi:hypothetical protein
MDRGQLIELVIICLIIILILSISGCIVIREEGSEYSEEDWRNWPIIKSSEEFESGYSSENSDEIVRFDITEYYVTKVIFELTWEDEPSQYLNGTNEPDEFNITVFTPWHESFNSGIIHNSINEEGQIIVTIEIQDDDIDNSSAYGEWTVNIHCGECGDDSSLIPSLGERKTKDAGNSWELSYYYEYHSNN